MPYGGLLMRSVASFLLYTGYSTNFINDPMSRVLLQILVHVLPQSYLYFLFLASLRLKHVIKYCTTVYERNGKILVYQNSGEVFD